MHPRDAAARGLRDGERVRLFNGRGAEVMPGVVCLPEGVWCELNAQGEDVAGAANMVTSMQGTSPSTACIMHGVSVDVGCEDGR